MKGFSAVLTAASLATALALAGVPAMAQQAAPKQGAAPAAPAKPLSPASLAAAKEILTLKNATAMYANAVPGLVSQAKNGLVQQNLNYQKDLDEVAVVVAKNLAGREKEIGEGMAQIYATEFTEQELKDLVAFYKTPLGAKLLANEPRAIQLSMTWMQQWAQGFQEKINEEFRSEMKKRNKPI
jgi:hypothetical protein